MASSAPLSLPNVGWTWYPTSHTDLAPFSHYFARALPFSFASIHIAYGFCDARCPIQAPKPAGRIFFNRRVANRRFKILWAVDRIRSRSYLSHINSIPKSPQKCLFQFSRSGPGRSRTTILRGASLTRISFPDSQFGFVNAAMFIIQVIQLIVGYLTWLDCNTYPITKYIPNSPYEYICPGVGRAENVAIWFFAPTCAMLIVNLCSAFFGFSFSQKIKIALDPRTSTKYFKNLYCFLPPR